MHKILHAFPPLLLALCLSALGSTPAHACSCLGPTSVCEAFWETPVVFLGSALDVREAWSVDDTYGRSYYRRYRSALFYVEEVFKGMDEAETVVDVGTGMGGGDCGYSFKAGERYLVFGSRDRRTGRIVTGICSVTHPVTGDDADLEYLRSLPTAPEEGYVLGFVESYWGPFGKPGSRWMPGLEISLEGKSGHYEARTDENGEYRIDHLPPGTYKYQIDLPGAEESHRAGEIRLHPKGCVELFFLYEVNRDSSPPPGHPESRPSVEGSPRMEGEASPSRRQDPGTEPEGRTREEARRRFPMSAGEASRGTPAREDAWS